MAAEDGRQLKCLLLPVKGTPVIVPNSAVAEIITQQDIAPSDDTPDWFLGTGSWRGAEIPLIAFDRLCGERQDVPPAPGRFIILFGLEGEGAPPFYGIRIEALPRSETVDAERLRTAAGPAHASECVAARATVGGDRECLVPDFDALAETLARYARSRA